LSHGGGTSNTLAISKPEPDTIMTPPVSLWMRRCWEASRDLGQLNRRAFGCIFGRTLPIAMKKSAATNAIALGTSTG
jgi:hypothetical protein